MALTDAAYQSEPGGPLDVDRELYDRIGSMTAGRELVDSFTIPIRSGRAWEVPAGHVCRIVTIEGPQVADLNLWNLRDPRERCGLRAPASSRPPTCPSTTGCGPPSPSSGRS